MPPFGSRALDIGKLGSSMQKHLGAPALDDWLRWFPASSSLDGAGLQQTDGRSLTLWIFEACTLSSAHSSTHWVAEWSCGGWTHWSWAEVREGSVPAGLPACLPAPFQ